MENIEVRYIPFNRLRSARDEWSDEIPEEIIHSGKYKCRVNWFVIVKLCLEMGLEDGMISDPEIQQLAGRFIEEIYSEREIRRKRRTTIQEIQRVNSLINLVLGENTDQS